MRELFSIILAGAVGGGGLVGLFFYFVRRAVEKRLKRAEDLNAEIAQINEEIAYSKTEWYDAIFELCTQLYLKSMGKEINSELEDAYKTLVCAHRKVRGLYIKKSRMLKGE